MLTFVKILTSVFRHPLFLLAPTVRTSDGALKQYGIFHCSAFYPHQDNGFQDYFHLMSIQPLFKHQFFLIIAVCNFTAALSAVIFIM